MRSSASVTTGRPAYHVGIIGLVFALLPLCQLVAQRPDAPRRTAPPPPPHPDTIWVQQSLDGVVITWPQVAGAKSYLISRTRAGYGWTRIMTLGSQANSYLDRDVLPGIPHRYQVATIDSGNRMSRPVSSAAIVPAARSDTNGPQPGASPFSAVATMGEMRAGGREIVVRLGGGGEGGLRVERQTQIGGGVSRNVLIPRTGSNELRDIIPVSPEGDQTVWYTVTRMTFMGALGRPIDSNKIIIPRLNLTTSDPVGSPITAPSPPGVLVTFAAPANVRVGESLRLATAAGAECVSLNPGIATVTTDGNVSGVAPGEAQIIAVTRGANGTVLMSAVRVTVSP